MDTAAAYEMARDAVAARLTRNRGEYIIRFGVHPSRADLFGIEGRETVERTYGISCTASELRHMESVLLQIADEIGAKVLSIDPLVEPCAHRPFPGIQSVLSIRIDSPCFISCPTASP